jgi:hypothetical protein
MDVGGREMDTERFERRSGSLEGVDALNESC